jgi:hypothetical protein
MYQLNHLFYTMSFSYESARYPIPWLTPELIVRAIVDNSQASQDVFQSLREINGIPLDGNRYVSSWEYGDTAITSALKKSREYQNILPIYVRIARLIGLLYRNCGIPVLGAGSGFYNPLSICAHYGNLPAATVLLQETDARIDPDSNWKSTFDGMVADGQAEMLRLFSMYKPRTFPDDAVRAHLNEKRRPYRDIPLFKAVLRNDAATVHVLITCYGADPYVEDSQNRRAIDMTVPIIHYRQNGQVDPQKAADRDIIERLLQPVERAEAFAMSQNRRLGENSLANALSPELIRLIRDYERFT